MENKELLDAVVFTGLYEPRSSWRKGNLDNQCYNYCVPFRYEENKIVMVEDYILISIKPEWLCKILNGEKTIEIRKKVLKEMI